MIIAKLQTGLEDLSDCHAIRRAVFMDEQGVPESLEMDDQDADAFHLVVYDGKTPVATGRLCLIDDHAILGRIATRKEERKKGYGDLVVRMLIRKAVELGYDRQYLHAQITAQAFYEKLGFVCYGEPYEEAKIPHISMYHEGDVSGSCKS